MSEIAADIDADAALVHPDLRELYRTVRRTAPPPPADMTLAERRAAAEAPGTVTGLVEAVELAEVIDLEIPVATAVLPARLYRPMVDTHGAGHVHFHGGGFVLGSLAGSDVAVRLLTARTGATIVSVGYRLAPEHRWPIPPEDCYAATCWVHEHATELGVDPDDLSVGGESAGANLAAVVALMARDRGGPPLAAQLLMIGVYDLDLPMTPSLERFGHGGFMINHDELLRMTDWYLESGERSHPYASPIRAAAGGLPAAVVVSATCDPLFDQSVAYADHLRSAGVQVAEVRCEGHLHGSMMLTGASPSAAGYIDATAAALAAARARA